MTKQRRKSIRGGLACVLTFCMMTITMLSQGMTARAEEGGEGQKTYCIYSTGKIYQVHTFDPSEVAGTQVGFFSVNPGNIDKISFDGTTITLNNINLVTMGIDAKLTLKLVGTNTCGNIDLYDTVTVDAEKDARLIMYYEIADHKGKGSSLVLGENVTMTPNPPTWKEHPSGAAFGYLLSGAMISGPVTPTVYVTPDGKVVDKDEDGTSVAAITSDEAKGVSYDAKTKVLSIKDLKATNMSINGNITLKFIGTNKVDIMRFGFPTVENKITLDAAPEATLELGKIHDVAGAGISLTIATGVTQKPAVAWVANDDSPHGSMQKDVTYYGPEKPETIPSSDDDSVIIKDTEKTLPAGTTMKSEKKEKTDKTHQDATTLADTQITKDGGQMGDIAVFELNLEDVDGTEIHELNDAVSVTMPVPIEIAEDSSLKVYRVNDDKTLTECKATVADGKVTFVTNHFSTYIFVEVKAAADDTGKDDTGKEDTGKDDTGKDNTGKDDTGKEDTGKDDTSKDDTGKDDTGKDNSDKDNSGKDESGKDDTPAAKRNGWVTEDGVAYWYEDDVRQGYDPNNKDYRGKEINDPATDDWYWLDNDQKGAVAKSKDVYQESLAGDWGDRFNEKGERIGKWVRYDKDGHMIKGWCAGKDADAAKIESPNKADGKDVYYFDQTYGTMAKGYATIDKKEYFFNIETGVLERTIGEVPENGWKEMDGKSYWYENYIRQGYSVNPDYRGKEINDPATDDWYWLDNIQEGAKAVSKDVYQISLAGEWGDFIYENGQEVRDQEKVKAANPENRYGKWVRYDKDGHMIKGWCAGKDADAVKIESPDKADGKDVYYFDQIYGTMAKGDCTIDEKGYAFDASTGILVK